MLLQDVFILENLTIIEESKNKGTLKIAGVFQRAEEANNNNRIYPQEVLDGQITKLQPMIEERRLCGELDHPSNDTVKLSNASHLITKLQMNKNEVIGEAEILNTPAGLTAQALIKGGVKVGISSRGMGTLSEEGEGVKKVNEDFNLVTFDLVADPSTRGAYPGLSESIQREMCEGAECVIENVSKTLKERVFITLLKNKLTEGSGGLQKLKRKRDAIDKAAGPGPRLSTRARELSVRIGRRKAQGERRAATGKKREDEVDEKKERVSLKPTRAKGTVDTQHMAKLLKKAGVKKLKKKPTPREQARADSYEDEGGAVDPDKYEAMRDSFNPVYSVIAKLISDSTLHPTDIGGFDKERQRAVTPATPEEMKREQERRKKAGLNPDGTKKKPVKKQTNREVARATRHEDEGGAVKSSSVTDSRNPIYDKMAKLFREQKDEEKDTPETRLKADLAQAAAEEKAERVPLTSKSKPPKGTGARREKKHGLKPGTHQKSIAAAQAAASRGESPAEAARRVRQKGTV